MVVTLVMGSVVRVVASLREGRWDDAAAVVTPMALEDLAGIVEWFGQQSIYGWEFFDPPEHEWLRWADRLSLDERWEDGGVNSHVIDLFQEGGRQGAARHLDLRVWFETLRVEDRHGSEVGVRRFAEDGRRWWDGLYGGDERTEGFGITPLKPDPSDPP